MSIPSNFEQDVDTFVQRVMQAWDITGLSLAIVKDDQVLVCKGYGVRDIRQPNNVDENTRFAIASNTKAFVATAIGMLVQEGKLRWDDLVTDYLPWFRLNDEHASHLLTIRDLLCHRSGLGTWSGDMLLVSNYTTEEIVRRVRHIPLSYPFRAGYGYSNLMFITASLVIKAVTGMSWGELIEQRLFKPIGMSHSLIGPARYGEQDNLAMPHVEINGKIEPVPARADAGWDAAGGILSCASDLALWLRVQLNKGRLGDKQIIDPAIIEETHTPHSILPFRPPAIEQRMFPSSHVALYGLGWFLNDLHGKMLVRHTGGLDGMLSSVAMIPEENLGVAVLTNKQPSMGYMAITFHLFDTLLGIAERDWLETYEEFAGRQKKLIDDSKENMRAARVAGTQTSVPLDKFAGEYDAATLGGATIRAQDGGLQVQLKAHPSLSGVMTHWHYDSFMCKWDDPILGESLVPFSSDGQGNITGFKVKIREDWLDTLEHSYKKI
jgi:CubicO group peptidase (beta-lactamase class C family)